MKCKYYIMLGSSKMDIGSKDCLDVSSMITNRDDIKISYVRTEYGGIIRKCTSSIVLVHDARKKVIDYYRKACMSAVGSFAVYGMMNDWTFESLFECPIDFTTFKYDTYTASIDCLDNSVAALIRSNKNTKYEYNVSDIKSPYKLSFDRITIRNEIRIKGIGSVLDDRIGSYTDIPRNVWWFYPKIVILDSNVPNPGAFLVEDSVEGMQTGGIPSSWGMPVIERTDCHFLECLKDCMVSVDLSDIGFLEDIPGVVLVKVSGDNVLPLTCGYSNILSKDKNTYAGSIKWSGFLKKGERLQVVRYNYDRGHDTTFNFKSNCSGFVIWDDRKKEVEFDVISPEVLLSRLVASMCPGMEVKSQIKYNVNTGGHDIDNIDLRNTMLCPAECIRQFGNAKLYTSFADFSKWMETVFGYVCIINEKGIEESFKIIDFNGFFESFGGESQRVENVAYVKFETRRNGSFYAFANDGGFSRDFIGSSEFQLYENTEEVFGYKVHTDRYYRDTTTYKLYCAENYKIEYPGTVGRPIWGNRLIEAVIEINERKYNGKETFGEIFSGTIQIDNGHYNGEIIVDNIYYVVQNKTFYYKDKEIFWRSWDGSDKYNIAGLARLDKVFCQGNQTYAIIKECLVRCVINDGMVIKRYPTVSFIHRNELYRDSPVLAIENISEVTYNVAKDRLYSTLSIGYKKQEYELGNSGNEEFNSKAVYMTGLLDNKELDMLSPYRADSYGIEELSRKTDREESGGDKDMQLFAVSCMRVNGRFEILRDNVITGASLSVFNSSLNFVSMIKNNDRYLASLTDKLKFVSMEGNSSVVIGNIKISDDIELKDPLFRRGNIKFSTDKLILPDDFNYRVEINWDGHIYSGYIKSLDFNVEELEHVEYELIES